MKANCAAVCSSHPTADPTESLAGLAALEEARAGRPAGGPMGSGAVEATGRQYQGRGKRPGQCGSQTGDESRRCLETFWRNARWHLLFPYTTFNPARN
jgi:hypothetical protein